MKKYKLIIILIVLGGILGLGASLITAEVVKHTSGEEFCGSCHSMEPMAKTFKLDIHGGQNEHGFVAECVDCHLPHDSVFNYMVAKTAHGINDVFKETFTDTSKIDWLSRRKNREEFVYDDGCLECHRQLLDKTTAANPKSLVLHAKYKTLKETEEPLYCVSCHVTIGHDGQLRSELNKTSPEYTFGVEQ
ncbi:cytochrome c3 family protein [Photobacterium sp.]|uniref:cytochrome c3 family protein n=1 Tax=Photobacterium sp. TaxID=660 RepID=UPI00299E5708|nr:NapC/NirT family cytochrome c [Photobacterium sp.]MDX1302670.1 NapC/NirT family cytochrome c [Photobacterium sp.]